MDEILIGDKKYVSSKRAAKITGYAKDYVGQLCREGRVPARLVGRSWYVLESAIEDHRFGEKSVEGAASAEPARSTDSWEAPRYEAVVHDTLPPVNKLREPEEERGTDPRAPHDSVEHLQNAWQAWFDKVAELGTASASEATVAAAERVPEEEGAIEEEVEEVAVPIRAIYAPPLRRPEVQEEESSFAAELEDDGIELAEEHHVSLGSTRGRSGVAIRVAGLTLAVISVFIAVLGSGYVDQYILSSGQARVMAGVSLYNK